MTVARPAASGTTESASGRTSACPGTVGRPRQDRHVAAEDAGDAARTVAGIRLLSPTNSPTNFVAGAE